MKLKIIQEGWAGYTGNIGGAEFKDGVSVNEMSPFDAQRISACVQCEDASSGVSHNPAAIILAAKDLSADEATDPDLTQLDKSGAVDGIPDVPYTRAELESIAEQDGINGLRVLSDPLGIKATSIVKLIEALLKAGISRPGERVEKSVGGNDLTVEGEKQEPAPTAAAAPEVAPVVTEPVTEPAKTDVAAAVNAGGAPGDVAVVVPANEPAKERAKVEIVGRPLKGAKTREEAEAMLSDAVVVAESEDDMMTLVE